MVTVSVVVPVSVEAMCVGPNTDPDKVRFVGPTADFSDLPARDAKGYWRGKPYLADSITAFPKPTLRPGMHLHWALPDALTHGATQADGTLAFPPAPNRWLVVRCARNAGGERRSRGWVVESDYIDRDAKAATISIPFRAEKESQYYRFVGRAVALEQWRESMAADRSFQAATGRPLTAAGYGDATFAAYYPNCRNIFGFHDDLDDVEAGAGVTVGYVVVGWFSDPALDPLVGGDLQKSLQTLRWQIDTPSQAGRTLCSGVVRNIVWDAAFDYFPPRDNPLDIAIGDTTVECVSALLAGRLETAGMIDTEYLLNAVQMGLMANAGSPGQAVEIEAALHAASFSSLSGGTEWRIEPANQAPGPDGPLPTDARLGSEFASALTRLNALQGQHDARQSDLVARRRTLYLDWYRYMRLLHGDEDQSITAALPELKDSDAADDFLNQMRDFLQSELDAVGALATECGSDGSSGLAGQVRGAADTLRAAVEAESAGELTLRAGTGPRYWSPTEPVFLFAGDDVRPPTRYGGDKDHSPTGDLPCRTASEIVDGLTVTLGTGPVSVAAVDVGLGLTLSGLPVAAEAGALIAEAVLTDPANASMLARLVAGWSGAGVDVDALSSAIDRFLRSDDEALPALGGVSARGHPGCRLGITDWRGNPWLPLFFNWEVEYLSTVTPPDDTAVLASGSVLRAYDLLEGAIDLSHRGGMPSRVQVFEGVSLLTQNIFARLKQTVGDAASAAADPALQEAIDRLTDMPVLTQVLSGFNQALLTRKQCLQLDIHDPTTRVDRELFDQVRAVVARNNTVAPVALAPLHPIRGGFLRLRSATIIDAFGQVLPLDLAKARLLRAGCMRPADPVIAAGGFAHLAPRLVQPARLEFRLAGARNTLADPTVDRTASPVCGWLLVNNLDPGLSVYDTDGTALGILRLIGGGRDVVWQPAPGTQPGASAAGIDDPHLAEFVAGVLGHPEGGRYLETMLHTIDRALETVAPQRPDTDPGMAFLAGRPLALVRASLSLSLMEPPASATGWVALRDELAGAERQTRGLTDVAFDVRLGDLRQIDDGLVGYFRTPTGAAEEYRSFYAPAADGDRSGVMPPDSAPIRLTVAEADRPLRLTMLVDPHTAVHATTGILPMKAVRIAPAHVADPLRRMQISLPCHPVLAAEELRLPLPDIAGFDWRWVHRAADGAWSVLSDVAGGGERPRASGAPLRIAEGWLQLVPRRSMDRSAGADIREGDG